MNISTVNELIQSLESAGELSIREQKFLKLAKAYQQLAAENVEAKKIISECREYFIAGVMNRIRPANEGYLHMICDTFADETPVTDRIVAGIKADGRAEGINFAASRLAAAFNHGFVDKPMAEVGDVVRMILDAKADLANSQIPAEDGLSGEYAEKSLAEWEAELREGADK
ncbi:Uncharacterised protein [Klebsiella pneumoniae]|uniref:hypothetical protein n=1 Tax=Klebsiella pneumoniae TaxID=573 RepID=UPI00109102F0|nr:hypothetical protein [Klebsiella pneumoniae]VGL33860.1 Uncharacterised protein [Klebsiella pneumoniae]